MHPERSHAIARVQQSNSVALQMALELNQHAPGTLTCNDFASQAKGINTHSPAEIYLGMPWLQFSLRQPQCLHVHQHFQ